MWIPIENSPTTVTDNEAQFTNSALGKYAFKKHEDATSLVGKWKWRSVDAFKSWGTAMYNDLFYFEGNFNITGMNYERVHEFRVNVILDYELSVYFKFGGGSTLGTGFYYSAFTLNDYFNITGGSSVTNEKALSAFNTYAYRV